MIDKVKKAIKKPYKILLKLDEKRIITLDDERFLRYRGLNKGFNFDLKNPKTFNEKLQWLKLHDRKELYTKLVDKYEVKKYISDLFGAEYVIPTIGVYESFNEIDFSKLPNQFVIKCTHDSSSVIICKDKSKLDINECARKINKALKRNYYYPGREWPYKDVKPRILVEEYMEDESGELKDYKFFCFNGEPKLVLVCSERFSSSNMCKTWFNSNWELMPISEGGHRVDESLKKPFGFEQMKEMATKLSSEMAFVRVDFYEINSRVYFGEITFFPASGFEKFTPDDWNTKLGDMITLPNKEE